MTICPNCGGAVDETDPVCGHCGASLDDRGRGEVPRSDANRPGERERRPGERPRQHQGHPPADEDRRDLLKFGIGAVGIAGVGWLLLDDGSEERGTGPNTGSEVDHDPLAAVAFDNTSEGVEITIQSIQRADSIEVDCGNGSFVDWTEHSTLEAGYSFTCGNDGTYEPEPGDTVTVRATYDGNTAVLQKFDVE